MFNVYIKVSVWWHKLNFQELLDQTNRYWEQWWVIWFCLLCFCFRFFFVHTITRMCHELMYVSQKYIFRGERFQYLCHLSVALNQDWWDYLTDCYFIICEHSWYKLYCLCHSFENIGQGRVERITKVMVSPNDKCLFSRGIFVSNTASTKHRYRDS